MRKRKFKTPNMVIRQEESNKLLQVNNNDGTPVKSRIARFGLNKL